MTNWYIFCIVCILIGLRFISWNNKTSSYLVLKVHVPPLLYLFLHYQVLIWGFTCFICFFSLPWMKSSVKCLSNRYIPFLICKTIRSLRYRHLFRNSSFLKCICYRIQCNSVYIDVWMVNNSKYKICLLNTSTNLLHLKVYIFSYPSSVCSLDIRINQRLNG